MSQERERERFAYPRRLIEREISEDSRGISRRLNHLVLDQWLPLRLSHHMPPLPVGLHNLILPFPSARAELVVGRNEGTTSCNLTHVYDTIMSLLFLFLPGFLLLRLLSGNLGLAAKKGQYHQFIIFTEREIKGDSENGEIKR